MKKLIISICIVFLIGCSTKDKTHTNSVSQADSLQENFKYAVLIPDLAQLLF